MQPRLLNATIHYAPGTLFPFGTFDPAVGPAHLAPRPRVRAPENIISHLSPAGPPETHLALEFQTRYVIIKYFRGGRVPSGPHCGVKLPNGNRVQGAFSI